MCQYADFPNEVIKAYFEEIIVGWLFLVIMICGVIIFSHTALLNGIKLFAESW